jgi:AcrR family transcriptional regulator
MTFLCFAALRFAREYGVVMSRTRGARNKDFEERRLTLLARLTRAAEDDPGCLDSFNELAKLAGVTRTTLSHYFVDRDGVVSALIHFWASLRPESRSGAPRVADARRQLTEALAFLVRGWSQGLGQVFELGLRPSIRHQTLGPAFVDQFLEPMLVGFEAAIADLQRAGQLGAGNTREAALELVSPVVLALLHQRSLFGERCRPLDVDAFTIAHVRRFVKAWAPEPRGPSGRPAR